MATHPASSQGRRPGLSIVFVNGHEAIAGEVLVRYRNAQASADRAHVEEQADADEVEMVGGRGLRRMHSRRMGTAELLAMLQTHPDVEFVEPNYVIRALATPDDLLFGSLWGLLSAHIDATHAWDLSTGSRANVVTVIDTGIDYNHPDLAANVWSAPSAFSVTIGGIQINCAAGTHGFNAITNTCDPMDDHYHGTHVSGTIGAVGNNGVGVAGVNWTASIMGAKFLDAGGTGSTSNAINAIEFAIQTKAFFAGTNGANVRVLSNSWGGGGFSQSLLDEINRANSNDMLFVAAAGNGAIDTDVSPSYPASYNAPNIIAVAATNHNDQIASFSNHGQLSVHLGAPGLTILSTVPTSFSASGYSSLSGTSMATPHVAGAAALLLASCTLTTAQLKNALLSTVDLFNSLALTTTTGGRLNVYHALDGCRAAVTADTVTPNTGTGASQTFALQYTDAAGATDLTLAEVWFNTNASSGMNSCLAYYNSAANTLNLLNDAGTDWMSGMVGASDTLQNSACSLALGSTAVTLSGTTLTLSLPVTFTPAFAGTKNIYLSAANAAGVGSGWQPRGSWTIP